ncbi:unnamed protein product [Caretta caretta]
MSGFKFPPDLDTSKTEEPQLHAQRMSGQFEPLNIIWPLSFKGIYSPDYTVSSRKLGDEVWKAVNMLCRTGGIVTRLPARGSRVMNRTTASTHSRAAFRGRLHPSRAAVLRLLQSRALSITTAVCHTHGLSWGPRQDWGRQRRLRLSEAFCCAVLSHRAFQRARGRVLVLGLRESDDSSFFGFRIHQDEREITGKSNFDQALKPGSSPWRDQRAAGELPKAQGPHSAGNGGLSSSH